MPPIAEQPLNISSASDVVEEIRRTGMTTPARMVELIGDRPEYLADVAQTILEQRRKVVDGTMTPRDVAKAYYMTIASQGSDAKSVGMVEGKVPGFKIPEQFWSAETSLDGRPMVRPEEAAAAWLFSPRGQQALDDIERGVVNSEAWQEGVAVRRAFGDDRFHTTNVFSTRAPVNGRTQFNMDTLGAFTQGFNDLASRVARGEANVGELDRYVKRLNGVREAKAPFLMHALGFGDSPTADAVEINAWLTGVADSSRLQTREAQLVKSINEWLRDPRVGAEMRAQITAKFAEMRQLLPREATADLPDEVFNHVLHHWIWDRLKGISTTHEGFYNALRNALTIGPSPGPRGAGIGTQLATDAGNALAGSMVGAIAPADTPEERLRNTALGAAGFPIAGRLMRRAGGALGTPGIGPNGRPSKPTVEVLQQELDGMRALIQRARAEGNTDLEKRAIDRAWQLESALVDARNARLDLEPRITSDVGRRMDELPLTEESASDFAGIGRERVSPSAAADLTPPSAVATDMRGRMNSAPSYTGRGAGIGAQAAADVGASLQGGVVGAAAGYGMPADSEEQRRQNALYGAATGMVGMPIAGRVVGRGMRGAGPGTRAGIVPPHVADEMHGTFPVRVPTDPKAIRAIESIGGTIDPQRGVTINVTRAQGPQAAGMPATRGGVFYEAVPPGGRSENFVRQSDDPTGVGGSQVIPARPTTFRSPLIVSDAPGGNRGFDEAVAQLGMRSPELDAAQREMDAALTKTRQFLRTREAAMERWAAETGHGKTDWEAFEVTPEGTRLRSELQTYWGREDAARANLNSLQDAVPSSDGINNAIRQARQAGPEGSEARAQALKDVVRRYGGDEELIDPLLRVRGADASESEWAIRENILAAHARRNGYDGVVTVASSSPTEADILAHPEVVKWKAIVQEAQQELNALYDRRREMLAGGGPWDSPPPSMEDIDRAKRRVDMVREKYQAVKDAAYMDPSLIRSNITELIDVREGANPTPGAPNPLITEMQGYLDEALAADLAAQRRYHEVTNPLLDAGRSQESIRDISEVRAAREASTAATQRRLALQRALDRLKEQPDMQPGDPGFSVRADIQRPPGAQWAGVPFDPASAAMGGAAGAMSEGEDGDAGDPMRTAAGILLAGVGGGMSPGARRALQKAMDKAEALKAAGRADDAARVVEDALRRTVPGYEPRLSREPVLPGMEPPRRVPSDAGPSVSELPNRAPVLGDVPPSAIDQRALPGMDPLRDAQAPGAPGQFQTQLPPAARQALDEFPEARNWYERARMRNEKRMRQAGIEPPSPLRWLSSLVGNIGYSSMLGPGTLSVNLFTGVGEPIWGAPKELLRSVGRAVQQRNLSALREPGEMLAGAVHGMGRLGEALIDLAKSRGQYAPNPNFPMLSSQTADPTARTLVQLLEAPGRVWSGLPDAIFGTISQHAGEAREAAQIATNKGLKGAEWKAEVTRLLEDSRAVGKGELPTSPDVQQVVDAGAAYAKRQTYRDELGPIGRKAEKYAKLGGLPVLGTWASPFFRTPWNAALAQAEKSPIGFAMNRQASKFDKHYDAILGTAAILALGNYAKDGGVTGSGPTDPKEREMLQQKGWQPYSTLIGNVYVPNRMLGIFESPLNMAGEMHDAIAHGKADATGTEKWNTAAERIGKVISQNPYALSGIVSLMEVPKYGIASAVSDQLTRLTPAAATFRTIGTAGDTMERTTDRGKDVPIEDQIIQRWQSGVGMRSGLPEAQDAFGQPKANERPGGWALAPRMRQKKDDPIGDIFTQAGVKIGDPKSEISVSRSAAVPGLPLNARERREWDKRRGAILLEAGQEIAADPEWATAPKEVREKVLRGVMESAAKIADGQMKEAIGDAEITRRIDAAIEKKAS